MNIKVIIPVRENPDGRLPQKCLLPFRQGMNLTEWKIKQVLEVYAAKDVILSTNSEKLKKAAHKFGIKIHHRSDYLSEGDAASWPEVISGITKDIGATHIAWIHVTNPLTGPEVYEGARRSYVKNVVDGHNDSLITVNRLQGYYWYMGKPINYHADSRHAFSQDLKAIYKVTSALYMSPRQLILERNYLVGERPYMYEVTKRTSVDIDHPEDYQMALAL